MILDASHCVTKVGGEQNMLLIPVVIVGGAKGLSPLLRFDPPAVYLFIMISYTKYIEQTSKKIIKK